MLLDNFQVDLLQPPKKKLKNSKALFLVIIDIVSKYAFGSFMTDKTEVETTKAFKKIIAQV